LDGLWKKVSKEPKVNHLLEISLVKLWLEEGGIRFGWKEGFGYLFQKFIGFFLFPGIGLEGFLSITLGLKVKG